MYVCVCGCVCVQSVLTLLSACFGLFSRFVISVLVAFICSILCRFSLKNLNCVQHCYTYLQCSRVRSFIFLVLTLLVACRIILRFHFLLIDFKTLMHTLKRLKFCVDAHHVFSVCHIKNDDGFNYCLRIEGSSEKCKGLEVKKSGN